MSKGFSQDWLDKLKSSNDIVTVASKYINLSRKGKTWWACCPFHFEKTASFAINEFEQYYHCFGCGASGDVIKFVEKYEALDFYDACKKLAEYAGMELPEYQLDDNLLKTKKKKERLYQVLVDTAKFYYSNLKGDNARPALEYLAKRKLDTATIKEFGIGYSTGWNELVTHLKSLGYTDEEMLDAGVVEKKDGGKLYDCFGKRLCFPIFDIIGHVVGFSARVLEKTDFAKYKNTAQTLVFDKSRCIYGISQLKKLKNTEKINEVVIVEGQMDVISLFKGGVKNAVACMGTALTINHAKDLKRFADKVILCFDGDNAGKKATLRSIDILVNAGLSVYVVTIPNGHDPDEYINMFGKDEWDSLMASSLYWVEFLIKDLAKSYNLEKVDEKNKFINDALGVIKKLQTQSEQELYLKMVQELTNVVMSVLKGDLNNLSDKVEIKENIVNKEKLPTTNENKYIKSVKFVLATLLFKKDYAKMNENIRAGILNPDFVKIFDYIKEETDAGRTPIVSKIYDMFDDTDNNTEVNELIEYGESIPTVQDNADYYNDCVNVILSSVLKKEVDNLIALASTEKDIDKRNEYLKEYMAKRKK